MTRKNEPLVSAGDSADKMNESFGAYLRRERELRFIELDEISKSTMISLRFLEAIENDDFDDLPHDTFVRGFLRSYAKYIGLDQDEVITNYEHYFKAAEKEEPVEQLLQKSKTLDNNNLKIWGGVLATLVVAGILIYLAVSKVEEVSTPGETLKEEAVSGLPVAEPLVQEPALQPKELSVVPVAKPLPVVAPAKEISKKTTEVPAVTKKQPPPAEKQPPEATPPEAVPAEVPAQVPPVTEAASGVNLSIKAKKDSWILYQLDNGADSDIILKEGETKKLSAESKIVLSVGNAAGVELLLNGEPVPVLGKEGQVVRGLVFKVEDESEE